MDKKRISQSSSVAFAGVSSALCVILFTMQRFLPVLGDIAAIISPLPILAGMFLQKGRWFLETSLTTLFLIFLFNDLPGFLLYAFYIQGAIVAIYQIHIKKKRFLPVFILLTLYDLIGEFLSLRLITSGGTFLDGVFEKYWYLFSMLLAFLTIKYYSLLTNIIMTFLKKNGYLTTKTKIRINGEYVYDRQSNK